MPSAIPQPSDIKLSICITTFNRARFLGVTLDSILPQATDDCEIVILDGASSDDTERVVSGYTHRFDRLYYVKEETNSGIDRGYDHAMGLARGEYCWPMSDDDILTPGAIAAVLRAIRQDVSLIIVNSEARDLSMSKVLQTRVLNFEADRVYGPGEMDRLFADVGPLLNCNNFVIKREIWCMRERERYVGTLFLYIGVIFQESLPGKTLVIAQPVIICRMGNTHTFSQQRIEIIFVTWPSLVESLALSDTTKRNAAEPWKKLGQLLQLRGLGFYSMTEYRRWVSPRLHSTRETLVANLVALLPGTLVNAFFLFYYFVRRRHELQSMRESRFYFRNWRSSSANSSPAQISGRSDLIR